MASVFIETLELYHVIEDLPRGLLQRLEEEHQQMLRLWIELNDDG